MKSVSFKKLLLFNLIIVLMVLSALSEAAANVGRKKVLVLHSYHRGLGWTDSIAQGIDETLRESNDTIETFTEYMDTKRIFSENYLDRLATLLKFKYSGRSFNVIIASDDYAFHFLLKHHDSIFPGTPAVFCGVNLFKNEFIRDAPYFTGVVESFSIKETIDAAMAINPNLRRVYSIVDKTVTGKANLELLESVIPVFDKHLEFITITDKNMTEVTDEVSQLPPDSVILLLAFTSDRSGNLFSLEQSADLISAASNCPVYSFWDFHLNHGIIGGMLTTGVSQGTAAARLALRILSGEAPEDIPVIKTSPNRYIFDYNILKKFSIPAANLPPGSAVINRPPSFYEQYKRLVWQTLFLFGLLLVFTLALTLNLIRRRAAEVRLKASEEKFRTIFENSVVGFFQSTPEGRFVSVNPAFSEMLKYNSPEDVVSTVTDIVKQYYVEPEDRDLYKKILKQNGKVDGFEFRARCKDGNEIWVSNSTKAYFDENGNVVRYEGVVNDITKRKQAEFALADSERKWRNVLVNTPQIGIALDPDARIVFANEHFLKLTGWEEQEVLGRNWFDMFIPEQVRETVRQVFHMVMSQKDPLSFINYENEIITRDGELRNVSWSNVLTKDVQGNILDVTCLGIDLTERRQAEEELKRSEANYRLLVENQTDLVVKVDLQGRFLFVSPSFCRLFGKSEEDLLGSPFMPLLHEEDRGSTAEAMKALYSPPHTAYVEQRAHTKEGWRWLAWADTAVLDNEGKVKEIIGVGRDITERKQADRALRESEERLRVNFHYAPVGMAVIDAETRFLEVNRQICQTLGYAPEELIGRSFNDFTHQEDRDGGQERWRQLLAGDINFNQAEKRYVHKSGKIVWSIVTNSLIRDEEGRPRYFVSHLLDISAQKQAQEDSVRLEKQLQQAQKMESVGRLAGGVAHDFNNMLSVILGYTELALEQSGDNEPLHDALKEIQKAGQRSKDVTRQLLAFARKQTISPKVIDINQAVEGMTIMLQRLIGEDIDLVWLPDHNLWPVKMDPSQIDQVMANLCVNARDAISGVGKITIETGKAIFDDVYCADHPGFDPGDFVMLAVSDNGCGMDKQTLANLFEPFFTTKDVDKGTGLGLATVYGIVKQNNGFINVYSEPGQGTTFKIYLPRYRTAKMEFLPEKVKEPQTERGQETILLVEDEPSILKMTTMMLERLGYQVVAAKTPGEAIRLAQEHTGKIDLLVTDVVMPEMNGRDLAKNILSIHPNLIRLFMSGYTANVIAHHGVLDKGVNFIQKPFSREELGAKVREALDEGKV